MTSNAREEDGTGQTMAFGMASGAADEGPQVDERRCDDCSENES